MLKQLAAEGSRPGLIKIIYSNRVGSNIRRLAEKFGATHFFDVARHASAALCFWRTSPQRGCTKPEWEEPGRDRAPGTNSGA